MVLSFSEIFKSSKRVFGIIFFHLGMNFVPMDRILMAAELGFKLFDRLYGPAGLFDSQNVQRTHMNIKGISLTKRSR